MGRFIEGLRQKIQRERAKAEQAAIQEAESILDAARKQKIDEERKAQERSKNRPQWEKAKMQYDESDLSRIFKQVIDSQGAVGLYENPENSYEVDKDFSTPYFYAELVISTNSKRHATYYAGGHSDQITTKYIGVETDEDGTISFYGKRHPFDHVGRRVVKVLKAEWRKNSEVLENALAKAYHHPLTRKHRIYEGMQRGLKT